MKKFLRANGYAIYLGAATNIFAGLDCTDWRAYAIIIPTIVLISLRR